MIPCLITACLAATFGFILGAIFRAGADDVDAGGFHVPWPYRPSLDVALTSLALGALLGATGALTLYTFWSAP